MSKPFEVRIHEIYKAAKFSNTNLIDKSLPSNILSDESSDEEMISRPQDDAPMVPLDMTTNDTASDSNEHSGNASATDNQTGQAGSTEQEESNDQPVSSSGRPKRNCGPPKRLIDELTRR